MESLSLSAVNGAGTVVAIVIHRLIRRLALKQLSAVSPLM
jgi:hypothetical protein